MKADEWISVPIDVKWFAGTRDGTIPYSYPTYGEYQAHLAELGVEEEPPTPSQP